MLGVYLSNLGNKSMNKENQKETQVKMLDSMYHKGWKDENPTPMIPLKGTQMLGQDIKRI